MHQSRLSIYICMLLDQTGQPMTTEVIETSTLPNAIDRATELMQCCALPTRAFGYELWNRGRKLATWQDLVSAA